MTMPHLMRLPVELHLSVINKLELHDTISLATTNRYFRSIIKPPTHQDYLLAETDDWAKARQLFTCSSCTCFRRYTEFSDDMKKGKQTRGEVNAAARLCLRCGLIAGLYAPGTTVVINGKAHVLRRICGTFADRPTCQAACANCSPVLLDYATKSAYAARGQGIHEHATNRSERMLIDNTPEDELYRMYCDD